MLVETNLLNFDEFKLNTIEKLFKEVLDKALSHIDVKSSERVELKLSNIDVIIIKKMIKQIVSSTKYSYYQIDLPNEQSITLLVDPNDNNHLRCQYDNNSKFGYHEKWDFSIYTNKRILIFNPTCNESCDCFDLFQLL